MTALPTAPLADTLTGHVPARIRLPVLSAHPGCNECELARAGARTIGMASVLWERCRAGETDTAVFIIGQGPGGNEDYEGRPFVGASGRKLYDFYLPESQAHNHADVWCGNSTRCRVPADAPPSIGQLRACRPHLMSDLERLASVYRRVAVLCVGAPALLSVVGRSIDEQLRSQGTSHDNLPGNVVVFGTYHPAYVMREPARESTVRHHLRALMEWLVTGELRVETMPPIEIAPSVTPGLPAGPLAFDLETYGILRGALAVGGPCGKCRGRNPDCDRCAGENITQNVFHPARMIHLDGVAVSRLIVCGSICWRDIERALHVAYFNLERADHVARFTNWLRWADELWGQNIGFDNKLVRRVFGPRVIPAYKPLVELMVRTFLYDDLQIERSLKAVGPLLRITRWEADDKPVKMVDRADHPKIIRYVCQDSWATFRAVEITDGYCSQRFTRHPLARMKMAETTYKWFSDQVWTATLMEEAGVAFLLSRLEALHTGLEQDLTRLTAQARQEYTVPIPKSKTRSVNKQKVTDRWIEEVPLILAGKDAAKCKTALVAMARDAAYRQHAEDSPQYTLVAETLRHLELTDGGELSAGRNNRNLLIGVLPRDDSHAGRLADALALVNEASGVQKILTAYTGTLLHGKPVGEEHDWEVVPTKSKTAKNPTKRVKVPGTARILYDTSGTLIRNGEIGMAYPTWYIVPKSADEAGKGGGVRQFRWSAKQPALQTLPPAMKGTLTSRHETGVLHSYDLAQIEWRTAMWLANDKRGLAEIAEGIDIHSRSASYLLDWDILDAEVLHRWMRTANGRRILTRAPDVDMRRTAECAYRLAECEPWDAADGDYKTFGKRVMKWLRQNVGKSQNFAELYGGGGPVIVATTRLKAGIEIPDGRGASFVSYLAGLYPQRAAWRERLLSAACRDGALHLPILGQSRSFGGSEEAIRGQYRPQVLDFPVQTTAANILQCGASEIQRAFIKRRMASRVVINTHDAFTIDSPASEFPLARKLAERHIQDNWYLRELVAYEQGRPFPLAFERAGTTYRGCQESDFKEAM